MDVFAAAAEPCDMDCTSDTQEERVMPSRLGPKRKPRRRSLPLRKYDQLVALAEAPMHRRGMTISTPPARQGVRGLPDTPPQVRPKQLTQLFVS